MARAADVRAGRLTVREIHGRDEWNALVLALPHAALEQSHEWGEARRIGGWIPRRYVVSLDNVPIAATSISQLRLLGTPWSILYASRGPLVDWEEAGDRGLSAVVDIARGVAVETGALFLRVSTGIPQDAVSVNRMMLAHGFLELPYDWTIWNAPRVIMTLDLRDCEESLKRQLRRRFRDYITSAPKRGLSVRLSTSTSDLRSFHSSLLALGNEKRFPVRGLRYFETLWQQLVASGSGVLVLVEKDGKPVGGLLGAKFGRKAYMISTSVHGTGNAANLHQGPVLYWEFIRWAHAAGCEAVDLAGSGTNYPPHESDPGFGIYRFKQGFGSSLTRLLPYYDLPFRQRLYRGYRAAEPRILPLVWKIRGRLNNRVAGWR